MVGGRRGPWLSFVGAMVGSAVARGAPLAGSSWSFSETCAVDLSRSLNCSALSRTYAGSSDDRREPDLSRSLNCSDLSRSYEGLSDDRRKPAQEEAGRHETAVAWLRQRLAASLPPRCWEETRAAYRARLKRCCDEINASCDVEGLCREFPQRLRTLQEAEGGRLHK